MKINYDMLKEPTVQEQVEENFNVSPLQTGILEATNPFGFGDELIGGFEALKKSPEAIAVLKNGGSVMDALRVMKKNYRTGQQDAEQMLEMSAHKNPKSAIAGKVAGALVPVGVGALSKGAKIVPTLGQAIRGGAVMGGASGLGYSKAKPLDGELLEAGIDTAAGAGLGAGVGAGAYGLGKVAGKVASTLKGGAQAEVEVGTGGAKQAPGKIAAGMKKIW